MTISTCWQEKLLPAAFSGLLITLTVSGMTSNAAAAVVIDNDPNIFFFMEKPTGKFDEPSFGGFNYWISSKTGADFRRHDQYLNVGDETDENTAIATDWGVVADLSGTAFDFSIQHLANRNFSFSMTNTATSDSRALCWGIGCAPGSIATELLDGQPPISDYNGLQIEVRAQVDGASTTVENLMLEGLDIAPGSDSLFDGTVTWETPSSFLPFDDPGRIGQWILGNDLALNDWTLSGTVTLSRIDDALKDRNKVRLAVDLVKDTRIPAIPVPAALPLFVSALGLLKLVARRRSGA